MRGFTDQQPRIATAREVEKIRDFCCGFCGYAFKCGDTFRWVYCGKAGVTNTYVCLKCDYGDVPARYKAHWEEYQSLMKGKFRCFKGIETR